MIRKTRATAKNVSAAALLFAFDTCLLNQSFFSSLNTFISSARTFCNFSVGTINRNILISCESRVVIGVWNRKNAAYMRPTKIVNTRVHNLYVREKEIETLVVV